MATALALLCLEIPDERLTVFGREPPPPPAASPEPPARPAAAGREARPPQAKPARPKEVKDEKGAARKLKLAQELLDRAKVAKGGGEKEEEARLRDEARKTLKELLRTYAGTKAAEEAEELLESLPASRPEGGG
jgi:hypothetical protein